MQLNISKKDFAGDIPFYEEDVRRLENQVTGMLDSISAFSYEANMDVEVVGIDGNETPYQVTYKVANSSAFLFWKLPLLYGSRLPEKEDEIIVSASFARKIAGGDNPVGRVVRIASQTSANGITDYWIVNVVAENENGGSPRTECWFPLSLKPKAWLQVYALREQGISPESLKKRLARMTWVRGEEVMHVKAFSLKELEESRNTDLARFSCSSFLP